MKRKISSTLAVTLIAGQMQTVVFAENNSVQNINNSEFNIVDNIEDSDVENTEDKTEDKIEDKIEDSTDNVYKATGKLELDINFSLPIKLTDANTTNISVALKNGDETIGNVELGNDNNYGEINSEISYKLEALNGKKAKVDKDGSDIEFYHLTFENLPLGNYSLEIVGAGYDTANIEDIDISNSSKRVLVGTSDKTIIVGEKEEVYPGVFLAGNVDGSDLVTTADYELLKEQIKGSKISKSDAKIYDLNRDNKVDITDLSYVHSNIDKVKKEAIVVDTDLIINPENTSINVDTDVVEVQGDIKDILKDDNSIVSLQPKTVEGEELPEISEENKISLPISLGTNNSSSTVEQVVIKAPSLTGPGSGYITIPGAGDNGEDLVINFNRSDVVSASSKSARDLVDEIVIDLGKQVAVSEIVINVTGGRGNKNLVEIAKVEFLNNVYKEIPKPKMNVPVINKFTSATSVGNEHIVLGWEHQPNVTGYELKLERLNDNGSVGSTSTYRTSENNIKIEKVNGYDVYRVSIQSLSGEDWKSGYKDEQDDYNKTATGETNLLNNNNDKDGNPDNVDKDFNPYGWDSISGKLEEKANDDAPNGGNNYGADSIVELQVIPEGLPEGPEGITLNGLYKGLGVNWKAHKKAKDYDLYYRKVGEGSWVKANDPNEPKYVDTNKENNIPDGVTNLKPEEKSDKDELVRGTKYNINGLEDGQTYEIKMTATNHHGTGGLSNTYLGQTAKLIAPIIPGYKLINTPSDKELTNNIEKVEFNRSGNQYEGEAKHMVDNDYSTSWKLADWDGGVYYGQRMPIITFNKEYTFDTIRLSQRLDNPGLHTLPSGAKLRVYDDNGSVIKTYNKDDISINHKADKNGTRYAELVLKEPVTAKKVELNLSVYGSQQVSISELKFYEYDSLKSDVANLFKDDLLLELNEDVTQENIDELTTKAKTMDPTSMEYHPDQEQLLKDLQRAQDLLDDVNLKNSIKVLDSGIRNQGNTIGQSNNYQALGVAVKPGDKVNIYIGSNRKDTKFNLAITQHNGESGTAVQTYSQQLKVGKNEITIPESAFKMDYEKGGNLYLSFASNYDEVQNVKVRVSGGTQIPHLNVNNLIDDKSKEEEVKGIIREYIKELNSYVSSLPNRYKEEVTPEDKINNIYKYDKETSILNSTDIEGDRITLSLPADQVLSGIKDGLGSEEEQVERVYNTLLAWEQIMEISYAQQGLLENPVDFDGDGKITNNKLEELGGKSENEYFNANRAPRNRINIKYQRMFTGAFMYASSHHIGIGYGSSAGMLKGVPFEIDESGNLINNEGQLFGWGIGHEIGHVHDRPGLTYAEVTNNVLPLITQTFNDMNKSRLEGNTSEEGRYKDIYKRVTSGSVGNPNGSIGLGMYWQLHLAYDDSFTYEMLDINTDGDLSNDTFYSKLYRITREKGAAPAESGYDQTAQTYIMRSSDAVGKDLRPFFKAWGLVSSPKTNEYLDKMNYPVEDKAIQYLNDEARRKRVNAINENNILSITMSSDTKAYGTFGNDKNGNKIDNKSYLNQKEIPLNLSVNKDLDKVLGFEIIRKEATSSGFKEVPVGFVEADKNNSNGITTYTDVIDAANNRTYSYKVRAYDYNLNITEETEIGTIKITHDGNIGKGNWTFDTNTRSLEDVSNENSGHGNDENGSINKIKDNDKSSVYNASKGTDNSGNTLKGDPYLTVNLGTNKDIVGLKYTPGTTEAKKFSLKSLFTKNKETVYEPIKNYEVLVSKDGQAWTKVHSGTFETTKENTIYFNEAGNNNNTQLWAQNAQYVKLVAKGASTISIAELDVLGQPGDNIEIGVDNNDQNYKNGLGRLKSDYEYAPGKVIPKGSIIVTGEYTGDPAFNVPLVLNENDENFALESQVILLAELPEGSQLGEVAEGSWIYWITPEQEEKIIDGSSNIEGKAVKAELYRYNKLNSNNAPVGQRLVSDTFLYELPSDLSSLPIIDLASDNKRLTSLNNVVEIDKNTVKEAFENR